MNDAMPTPHDIQTISGTLRTCTPQQQRRLCIATLVLCVLLREAQEAIDIALNDEATGGNDAKG